MAEIADYQIITKGPFILEENNLSKNLSFTLPVSLAPSAGGVLGFVVSKVASGILAPSAVTLDIFANNNKLTSYSLKTGTICSLLETFVGEGGNLKTGSNTFKFTAAKGGPPVTITDVVLWFQRNV